MGPTALFDIIYGSHCTILATIPYERGCEKFGEMFSNPSTTIELNISLHDNYIKNVVIFSRTITRL